MNLGGATQHRVLVVEDDRDVRGVLALLIREEGLALDEVARAAEAVEALEFYKEFYETATPPG